jgi:outer membrane protein assembly factor BamD
MPPLCRPTRTISFRPRFVWTKSASESAIEEFQIFVNLFPTSSKVAQCNQLIDELRRKLEQKAFAEGQLYYDLRQYQSAVISFDNLLRDYPESPDVERVRYLIAKASFLLAENSVVEKKEERYGESVTRCNDFLEKYPSGKYSKEIKELSEKTPNIKAKKSLRKSLKILDIRFTVHRSTAFDGHKPVIPTTS